MKKIPVILDGDPGHDDAIAWVLAKSSPLLDIKAITTVSGNQTIEKTTYNARRIATLIGLDVPISSGSQNPLVSLAMPAPSVHGQSGLDGPELPEPTRQIEKLSVSDLIAKVIHETNDRITIIATGPLTNVATFILSYPELKNNIEHIYIMGGGITHGNWTPAAEFNILVDPEAAKIVFESQIPLTMAGLDVTEKALIMPEDFRKIADVDNHVSKIVASWLEFFYNFHKQRGYAGAPVHDAVAVTALIKPELLKSKKMPVKIETQGQYTRGCTVGDIYNAGKIQENANVIFDIDREGFVQLIIDACKAYKEE